MSRVSSVAQLFLPGMSVRKSKRQRGEEPDPRAVAEAERREDEVLSEIRQVREECSGLDEKSLTTFCRSSSLNSVLIPDTEPLDLMLSINAYFVASPDSIKDFVVL